MEAQKADLEKMWGPKREARYDTMPFVMASREKILDAIAQTAFTGLAVYGNCCRSTLWAIQIHLRRENAATLRASEVMAGGICGTGQTCGAVLGGLIAIGEALGSEEFRDLDAYKLANAKAKEFTDRIRDIFGSTNCFDLQDALMGWRCDDPSKAAKWLEAGGPTACAGLCSQAARLAAGIILQAQEAGA
jgi:C_GCAxxG_C_C family probable redox protein